MPLPLSDVTRGSICYFVGVLYFAIRDGFFGRENYRYLSEKEGNQCFSFRVAESIRRVINAFFFLSNKRRKKKVAFCGKGGRLVWARRKGRLATHARARLCTFFSQNGFGLLNMQFTEIFSMHWMFCQCDLFHFWPFRMSHKDHHGNQKNDHLACPITMQIIEQKKRQSPKIFKQFYSLIK